MHLVFWMTWWIDTYRSKDTLTRWIVGARGFSGKTRVTARSNVSHFLSVGIQASGNVERGEERGRPVADIIGRPPLGLAGGHRQERLGTIQRLHLALLVDRKDNRVRWRAHVQPDDIADLLDEVRVGRELECLGLVGLQPERIPDPDDCALGQPDRLGHAPGTPVGGGFRLLFQGSGDNLLDHRVSGRTRGTRSRLVGQPVEAVFQEALPPLANGRDVDAESGSDVFVVSALGTSQNDPRSASLDSHGGGITGPCVELLSFVVAEDQRVFGTTAFAHHRSHLENHMMNQTIYQGCLANF